VEIAALKPMENPLVAKAMEIAAAVDATR